MNEIIFEKNNSLSVENCKLISDYFKNLNIDFIFNFFNTNNDNIEFNNVLLDELNNNLNIYMNKQNINFIPIEKLSTIKYFIAYKLLSKNIILTLFNEKKVLFIYICFLENSSSSYLQFDDYRINIEIGKFILIPVEWFINYDFFQNSKCLYLAGAIYIDL